MRAATRRGRSKVVWSVMEAERDPPLQVNMASPASLTIAAYILAAAAVQKTQLGLE